MIYILLFLGLIFVIIYVELRLSALEDECRFFSSIQQWQRGGDTHSESVEAGEWVEMGLESRDKCSNMGVGKKKEGKKFKKRGKRENKYLLTEKKINSIKPSEKIKIYNDGNRLRLVVYSSGTKKWLTYFKYQGKRVNRIFGSYPEVSLEDARLINERIKKEIIHDRWRWPPALHERGIHIK